MPTTSKKTNKSASSSKPKVKMSDLKPSKDAKGGARRNDANRSRTSLNRVRNLN